MKKFEKKIEQLKEYFQARSEIIMAYIFGSYAKGRVMSESDFDIAVYFKPENNRVEYEENKEYPEESEIWGEVEKIVGINTDFVVLNRAKVTLADEILNTGIPVIIKDRGLYIDFLLIVSHQAEEFRKFIKDFWEIQQRSISLSERDKDKLIKRIKFLSDELSLKNLFKDITLEVYKYDPIKRLSVERWIENIINASIDIAKILLAAHKKPLPEKYRNTLLELTSFSGFDKAMASKLCRFTELRNILAHEYLEIRFEEIEKFIQEAEPTYKFLIDFVNKLL